MNYSIGEISKITNIPISTLRYYDKEGLFRTITRSNGGIRVFTDLEVGTIKVIECLKSTGMPIKDIKQYMKWYEEGDITLQERQNLFNERLEVAKQQMKELQKTMAMIEYKCWYYDTSVKLGSEEPVKSMPTDEYPDNIKDIYKLIYEE